MKIVWREDYDLHTDKLYKSPCCEDCSKSYGAVPVRLTEDNKCQCVNCGKIAEPDKKVLKWLQERQGERVLENEYCFSCGRNTMTVHQYKNPVTKKWQTAWGTCPCGSHMMV